MSFVGHEMLSSFSSSLVFVFSLALAFPGPGNPDSKSVGGGLVYGVVVKGERVLDLDLSLNCWTNKGHCTRLNRMFWYESVA